MMTLIPFIDFLYAPSQCCDTTICHLLSGSSRDLFSGLRKARKANLFKIHHRYKTILSLLCPTFRQAFYIYIYFVPRFEVTTLQVCSFGLIKTSLGDRQIDRSTDRRESEAAIMR